MRSSAAMESQRESYNDTMKKSVRIFSKDEEPFGWKLGLQKESEAELYKKKKFDRERQINKEKYSNRQQMLLKRGLDRLH